MTKLAQTCMFLAVGTVLFSGCHHAGKHRQTCDETCAPYGALKTPVLHAPAEIQQPPVTEPQLLPPAEPPKKVPPADEFLPPVKGPMNQEPATLPGDAAGSEFKPATTPFNPPAK